MGIITLVIILLSIFLWSMLFHELGHFAYFLLAKNRGVDIRFYYHNKKDFGIKVGYPLDYELLTKIERKKVYFLGIFWGLIPILIGTVYTSFAILLYPLYVIGCKKDIFNLLK